MSNENNKGNTMPNLPEENSAYLNNAPKDKSVSTYDAQVKNTNTENTEKIEKSNNSITDEKAQKVMQDIDILINKVRMQSEAISGASDETTSLPQTSSTDDIDNSDEEEMVDITALSETTTFPKVTVSSVPATEIKDEKLNKNKSDSTIDFSYNVKKEEKKGNHLFAKIFCGFLVALLLSGAAFYYMYKYVPGIAPTVSSVNIPGGSVKISEKKEEVVFLKGIQISGFDIGGKTLEEAKSLLALRGTNLLPQLSLTVNYQGVDYTYKNDDFEFTYDLNDAIERAYNYNKKVIDSGSNDIMSLEPTEENTEVDSKNNTVNFDINYKITQSSVQKMVKRFAKEVDKPCIEPHVSKFDTSQSKNSKRYTFKEGTEGTVIDQDELISSTMEALNNGETEVYLKATAISDKPKLKMADVKNATKLIGKFSTYTTNTYNANLNMATALEAINGTILESGDTLSFNECTGDSNQTSNGYYPAGVISNGEMTTGVGGGICQTATTLYNAAIMANMEIVEREPHLWCSYYVYGGLDATIDWGNIDLKLKNNSDYQMFFKCWMDGTQLNVEIYGWQSSEFDEVRTETELDWYTSESYGYNSYRVFYKNGKKVDREELPYSVYSLSNGGGIRGADPGDVSKKLTQPE